MGIVRFRMGNKILSRLLIVVAMKVEEDASTKIGGNWETVEIDSTLKLSALHLKIGDRDLFLVNSGIGNVNAGLAVAVAYSKLQIQGVLLLGVAGALTSDLDIGQLVVPSKLMQHDSFYSGEGGNEFMSPGSPYISISRELRESPVFDLDFEFTEWIFKKATVPVKSGVILTGNEFVGSSKRKMNLASTVQNAVAVEMEGGGIAQIARKYRIPFAIAKTVVDRLTPEGTIATDYKKFIQGAAENSGKIVGLICETWENDKE